MPRITERSLSTNVIRTPLHTRAGLVCKPEKQADKAFLLLEDGQRQRRQCLGPQLVHHKELAKSTLGTNWQSITKAQARQSHSIMLPPNLENCTLVVPDIFPYVNRANLIPQSSSLQKNNKEWTCLHQNGEHFCLSGRLSFT